MKVNTDGSYLGNLGPAGVGGIARDDQGQWHEGFAVFIGKATILKAGLWAAREAMLMIKRKDWLGATVEVDSTNVMNLLMEKTMKNTP